MCILKTILQQAGNSVDICDTAEVMRVSRDAYKSRRNYPAFQKKYALRHCHLPVKK
jgi:hypothetical protein